MLYLLKKPIAIAACLLSSFDKRGKAKMNASKYYQTIKTCLVSHYYLPLEVQLNNCQQHVLHQTLETLNAQGQLLSV